MATVTPGALTSEFKVTMLAQVVGIIVEGIAAILLALQSTGVIAGWIPMTLAVLGLLTSVATVLGYQHSRTAVKVEAIRAGQMAAGVISSPSAAAAALRAQPPA